MGTNGFRMCCRRTEMRDKILDLFESWEKLFIYMKRLLIRFQPWYEPAGYL